MSRRTWITTIVIVLLAVGVLVISAFVVDQEAAGVNLVTEAAGVATGTVITVLFIDELRRRREHRDTESLQKNRLIRELSQNLTCIVTRYRRGASPPHHMMTRLRETRQLSVSDIGRKVMLNHAEAMSLLLAIAPIREACVKFDAIDSALADGVYQTVENGLVEEAPVHQALERVRSDLDRLRAFAEPTSKKERSELLNIVAPINRPGNVPCEVPGHLLLVAYSYHDVCENLLREQTSILRYLLDRDKAFSAPERRPRTPLGADTEQSLDAEAVLPLDIVHLTERDIYPFGSRQPAWLLGESRQAQIAKVAAMLKVTVENDYNVVIDEDAIATAIAGRFDEWFASNDDGIDEIPHPRATQ